jgi:putative transposase
MEDIIKTVNMEIKDENLAKKASLNFCHRYSSARLREIGERFGLSDAAVTQASRRMRVASENDETLRKRLSEINVKLKLFVVET